MRRHWHKTPLLVRQALPGLVPPVTRAGLFALAARDDVESRLVRGDGRAWHLRHGPIPRRSLPPLRERRWTLLVQGVDLHVDAAHALLQPFRFLPDARLDDLMVSWASDGGGVGPHVDAYDVFLVQAMGRRRWRIGPVPEPRLRSGVPLRILSRFEPQQEWVLEPGDLLYLPPGWGHDGVAIGECMTCSVGFRAPSRAELVGDLAARLHVDDGSAFAQARYRDPGQGATQNPGRIPRALVHFAAEALRRTVGRPQVVEVALGESLTEPKPRVWFEPGAALRAGQGVRLDARTRMMYDGHRLYVNGESYLAGGRDARLMQGLADRRALPPREVQRLTPEAARVLRQWVAAGWMHGQ